MVVDQFLDRHSSRNVLSCHPQIRSTNLRPIANGGLEVIDLFSGAGGFSLGAHLAGFHTALAVDTDYDLTSSFKSNFPRSKYRTADLLALEPQDLLNFIGAKPGYVEGILGGPPCQGFSLIGSRKFRDPRNSLVRRFFHFVRSIKPAFFIMENVPGILSHPFRTVLDEGIEQIVNQYNVLGPLILDTADFGAATSRPRVVVIGYIPDRMDRLREDDLFQAKVAKRVTVYEAIHDLPNLSLAYRDVKGRYWARYSREPETGPKGAYARRARRKPNNGLASPFIREAQSSRLVSGFQPTIHTPDVVRRFKKVAEGSSDDVSRCPRLAWEGLCTTLRAGTGRDRGSYQSIRPIHPTEHRVITVREAARLQGFPDWFLFHPTKWHSFRMIGNSVSPYLASATLRLVATRLGSVRQQKRVS